MGKRWSTEDEKILIEIYPKASQSEIVEFFPGKTIGSIVAKARRLRLRKGHIDPEVYIPIIEELRLEGATVRRISEITGLSMHCINRLIRDFSICKRDSRIYKLNDYYFDSWHEGSAYWAGFIAADGCLKDNTVSFCLSIKDRNHMEKLKECLEYEKPVLVYEKNRTVFYRINSQRIYDRLVDIGITPRKSNNLKFPSIPEDYVSHFLRGYFDGDGSVFVRSTDGKIGFKLLGTKEFLEKALDFLPVDGINVVRDGSIWRIQTVNHKAMEILKYLYNDATIFLERKYKIFEQFQKKLFLTSLTK